MKPLRMGLIGYGLSESSIAQVAVEWLPLQHVPAVSTNPNPADVKDDRIHVGE